VATTYGFSHRFSRRLASLTNERLVSLAFPK
jgi:hypothetical protein